MGGGSGAWGSMPKLAQFLTCTVLFTKRHSGHCTQKGSHERTEEQALRSNFAVTARLTPRLTNFAVISSVPSSTCTAVPVDHFDACCSILTWGRIALVDYLKRFHFCCKLLFPWHPQRRSKGGGDYKRVQDSIKPPVWPPRFVAKFV